MESFHSIIIPVPYSYKQYKLLKKQLIENIIILKLIIYIKNSLYSKVSQNDLSLVKVSG